MKANRNKALLLAAAFALLFALTGCVNPFSPATPEAPNVGGVVPNFSTPEKVLDTIAPSGISGLGPRMRGRGAGPLARQQPLWPALWRI